MLTSLRVRDFAIIDQVAVEFGPGMTVLTGETGAGKSILVDALGLVLGERGGSQLVRVGADRAEFSAQFDVSALPNVRAWLNEQAVDQDGECLLRRVIGSDGRSRAFINGNAVTVQQLKFLGELLLDIHGQHFNQSLGRVPVQRNLLDHFGELIPQRHATESAYERWSSLHEQLQTLLSADADRASRLDLLGFQLTELDALDVSQDEITALQAERQRLLHSDRLAVGITSAMSNLSDDETVNASTLLSDATRSIEALFEYDAELEPVVQLLQSADIQVTEAVGYLQRYGDTMDLDPARRDWVEERLDAIQSVARKHRIPADEIPALRDRLRSELDEFTHAEERGQQLHEEVAAAREAYRTLAERLSTERHRCAQSFAAAVTDAMSGLGMPGGVFDINIGKLPDDGYRPWGIDDIEFLISANPGQPTLPLSRVASGGELSRMSLAIQVIAIDGSLIPTMVFDEVDSGVGGRVAEMVGRRLRELGEQRQVLCVTHLAQVASLADAHFSISKVTDGKVTRIGVHALGSEKRVREVARMLGGIEITSKTLDHAAEMLASGVG